MEKKTVYTKIGKNYEKTLELTDALTVYKHLTDDLISKKINACLYIKSIKRMDLYNGFQKIMVYYDNNVKAEYIVKN